MSGDYLVPGELRRGARLHPDAHSVPTLVRGTFPSESSPGPFQVVLATIVIVVLLPAAHRYGVDTVETLTVLTATIALVNALFTRQGSSQPAL
ncbi:hypothetical protein GCM10022251_06310 [Phytohabitans flavus]|uniref:Uncharacterized protein n=1 Tax=Phytohabitans flavus TaxID=1076124 RepID=A0A6F8Y2B0_9ACTN|nr:hypothetical protein Pflav_066100 [Phytohabitans flavus]